jgi:hypothetical protein
VSVEGTGVSVSGTGVSVEGMGVSVDGTGVSVEGMGVSVDGMGVSVEGMDVYVGGMSVSVGSNSGVAVGGAGVAVSVGMPVRAEIWESVGVSGETDGGKVPPGVNVTFLPLKFGDSGPITSGSKATIPNNINMPPTIIVFRPSATVIGSYLMIPKPIKQRTIPKSRKITPK